MKIVMVNSVSFLPHQGRYRRVYSQARSLVEAGHEVVVVAWDRAVEAPRDEVVDGIRVERIHHRAGFGRLSPLKAIFWTPLFHVRLLFRLLRSGGEVFHTFNPDVVPPVALVAWMLGKPLVMDHAEPHYYHNWPPAYRPLVKIADWMERRYARQAHVVLVHNLYQVRKFRSYGVDHVLQVSSVPDRALEPSELPDRSTGRAGPVVFGRIGSVYEHNGIEELVPAFQMLLERGDRAKLLIAGMVADNFRATFDRLVAPLGDAVEVTGAFSQDQLEALYARIDVSVQLTPRTVFYQHITPTKFFDSLAHGVPVITSAIGDIPELLERHPAGLTVDETRPEDIRDAMVRLAEDAPLRARMVEAGLAMVRDEYCWERMSMRLIAMYRDLEESGRRRGHFSGARAQT